MRALAMVCALAAVLTASAAERADTDRLAQEVRAAETAFAKSMADRDLEAFAALVDDEAVFFGAGVLRGKAAVVDDWKKFFKGPQAPFSWEPKEVEVLDSGRLGISSGPVRSPDGKQVGVFNSIWRRGADGKWKVIFDKGCPPCDCKPAATQ
jgi:ketosteroid isomerase-like protein